MKILIVDDHPTNRKLLRVTLEAEGLTTLEATDGVQALAVLQAEREQPVDAIVSDIFMPGMDGFRFCHAVRRSEQFGHLPFVIYTSTYTSPDDEKLAREAGADHYIRKPCPTDMLVRALQEVVAAARERALEHPQPVEELEATREYSEALIKKLEEKNADLERAIAQQEMVAELSQYALATSSPLVSAVGQAALGALPRQSAQPRSGADNLGALFSQAARMVASALDVSYCAIWEALPEGRALRCRAGKDELGPDGERTIPEINGAGSGMEGSISGIATPDGGSPLISEPTGTLAVAIPGLERPFGLLEASAGAPRRFREEDVHFLEAIAGVLATALRRQRAEQELLRQREWLRVTLTSIGDGVIASDASGLITFMNPIAASLTGWTQEDALGRPIQQVFDIINAQTRQPAEDLMARVLRERRTVGLANDTLLLARDGREVPIEDSAAPILDAAGELAGVVLVFHDVSEKRRTQAALRQSEERLRRAQEIAHLGSWELDVETNQLMWSDEVYRIFGLSPQAFGATYEAFLEHVHPDDRAAVDAAYSSSLRENRDGYEIEHRVVRESSGEVRVVHEKCEHVRDASGRIVRSIGMVHDITERKEAEEAIRRAKEEWERTFDSVPDLVAILDDHFHIIRANQAMAQRLGLTPEQCAGHVCYECVHGLGRPPAFCPHVRTLADGQQHIAEVHEEHLGGDFLVSTTPLLDPEGQRIGSVHVARNITDRKRAEEALRESEERFRSLAEGLPELVWVSDADGNATYINPQYQAYAAADLSTVEARTQLIHPEDLPRVTEAWGETIRTSSDFEGEYRLRRHDGQYRWFLTRCVAKRVPSGEVEGWIGIATDIHDQKQAEEVLEQRVQERTVDLQASEERFRQLAENIQEVFWMFEPGAGRLLYVSPAYDAIWGRSRQELYERPASFADTVHPDDRQQMLQGFTPDWPAYDREFRIVRPDGSLRWIRLRSFPIYNDQGQVYRLAGIAMDRTEQKAAQDALFQAEQLTIAGKLAASLAHEINNPLQAVIGCLELANEVLEDGEDPGDYLQIASQEVQRTARIVDQLRSLGQPVQDEHKEPTDLNSLLNDILVLNKKRLQTYRVEVIWDADDGLPLLTVMPDPMRQVFLNLVINATDAMPDGGQLRLSTMRSESPEGVHVVVADTGTGISPDVLPHLFEAFYSTKSDGLGMGLFVSQSIVHQHSGRIEVESQLGEGSTFTVWLPA